MTSPPPQQKLLSRDTNPGDAPLIVAHRETNALLVSATAHDFEVVKALLDDLDRDPDAAAEE